MKWGKREFQKASIAVFFLIKELHKYKELYTEYNM